MNEKIWQMEEQLWTGSREHLSATLSDLCVMAFPEPIGTMLGAQLHQGAGLIPRWDLVAMTDQTTASPMSGVIVLAYRAEGRCEGMPPYAAICTSTYALKNDRWRLVQHHQSQIS
ncbi:MAG: hypothetical protein JJ920_14465 [Roseitalea sp.]|jgi:hypothetical protein|nr:hypothetical protein [Roseitalea sp.]MBO6722971.1 hypothetical protein [Roseitalea sp.]MBO6744114.1 hypothetical protein [Roseitalea sp.]